jgi:competence ComEA-like helix-hairpin-helix protein
LFKLKLQYLFIIQGATMKSVKSLFIASLLSVGAVSPMITLADGTQATTTATVTQSVEQKVNINTADTTTLEAVPGMTKHAAEAIVKYRDAHGAFKSVDDLASVPGVNKRVLKRVSASLTV